MAAKRGADSEKTIKRAPPRSEEAFSDKARSVLVGTIAILLLGFVVVTAWGVVWERPYMVQHGAVAVAALVVSATAAVGLKSWSDERLNVRHLEREQRRRTAYTQILEHATLGFGNVTFSIAGGASIRTEISVWASAPVVRALAKWNAVVENIYTSGDRAVGEEVELSEEEKFELQSALTVLAQTVRQEVNRDELVSIEELQRSLFASPTLERPSPSIEPTGGGSDDEAEEEESASLRRRNQRQFLVERGFPSSFEFVSQDAMRAMQRNLDNYWRAQIDPEMYSKLIANMGRAVEQNREDLLASLIAQDRKVSGERTPESTEDNVDEEPQ